MMFGFLSASAEPRMSIGTNAERRRNRGIKYRSRKRRGIKRGVGFGQMQDSAPSTHTASNLVPVSATGIPESFRLGGLPLRNEWETRFGRSGSGRDRTADPIEVPVEWGD